MTRRTMISTLGAALLTVAAPLSAHPGHDHKILGTVTMAASDHVMVKDTEGKDQTVYLNAQTKITRAKKALAAADIKKDMRVVITAVTEKDRLVAKNIELGPEPTTK